MEDVYRSVVTNLLVFENTAILGCFWAVRKENTGVKNVYDSAAKS